MLFELFFKLSTDPLINKGLKTLSEMGFKKEDGLLTLLLEMVDGIIGGDPLTIVIYCKLYPISYYFHYFDFYYYFHSYFFYLHH